MGQGQFDSKRLDTNGNPDEVQERVDEMFSPDRLGALTKTFESMNFNEQFEVQNVVDGADVEELMKSRDNINDFLQSVDHESKKKMLNQLLELNRGHAADDLRQQNPDTLLAIEDDKIKSKRGDQGRGEVMIEMEKAEHEAR